MLSAILREGLSMERSAESQKTVETRLAGRIASGLAGKCCPIRCNCSRPLLFRNIAHGYFIPRSLGTLLPSFLSAIVSVVVNSPRTFTRIPIFIDKSRGTALRTIFFRAVIVPGDEEKSLGTVSNTVEPRSCVFLSQFPRIVNALGSTAAAVGFS